MLEGKAVDLGEGRARLLAPQGAGARDFWLTWPDASMDGPGGFPDGATLHVTPAETASHGAIVVVQLADGSMVCRKYRAGADGDYLEAVNPDWPGRIMPMPPGAKIRAVVRSALLKL